ncbi:hypothetical protein [Mucilaginibacter ginsenosidivorans]|nr:hypothetical protein [Mucilaginibacter ginsenosidivorans]
MKKSIGTALRIEAASFEKDTAESPGLFLQAMPRLSLTTVLSGENQG